jgi:spore coat polysaccharide biosynthesis protein SpsF (cytidylyltransferase family)
MEMARRVYDNLYRENEFFSMNDILQLINKNPEIALINQDVQRSTMYKKNDF